MELYPGKTEFIIFGSKMQHQSQKSKKFTVSCQGDKILGQMVWYVQFSLKREA